MKIVFMGTPDFAAASLRHLLACSEHELLAVYCQPDRPAGRGQNLQTGPVKKLALEHAIPVFQPLNFKDPAELERLANFGADLFVVAAYGLILPQALLDIPPLGAINVHSSLLPRYRGAAPIQRAVMNGDIQSGVSIMRIELRLDAGPVLMQRALGIDINQTAGELHDELAELGGKLLVETIQRMQKGRIAEIAQDESRASYAAKLSKADGILDLNKTVLEVHNQARGVTPWPGAQLTLQRIANDGNHMPDMKILLQKGEIICSKLNCEDLPSPGSLGESKSDLISVACADGFYGLKIVKPAGGKSMDAKAFANGYLRNCTATFLLP